MKLTTKWILAFTLLGVYVMGLGGVFYYNLFKWTFDEKLKQDVIETVKQHSKAMTNGLLSNQKAITFEEYDIMLSLAKDERITSMIYLNRVGVMRWHKESRFIGIPWDDYRQQIPPPTDAINQAFASRVPKVQQVKGEPFYEMAIPFSARGDIIGVLDILVSRAGAEVLIGSAMRKYVFGAIGVLLLLGVPLYLFLHHYVISPMEQLRDSVEGVSMKNFELRFPERGDEVGQVAYAINGLMGKMKREIQSYDNRDKTYREEEQRWWRSLLNMIVPGSSLVIVVDENNNILYTNFELAAVAEGNKVHLLDVVDTQQQTLLRLVGEAFEKADVPVSGETMFKGKMYDLKVLHVGQSVDVSRTLILFTPKAQTI